VIGILTDRGFKFLWQWRF